MTSKYLIVGSGLAGLSLAISLLEKGCAVTLINSGENHSSKVAAGQINPLVFRRMTKSWRVDDFLPFAKSFYKNIEDSTQTSFVVPISIRRLFAHSQEKDLWLQKQELDEFKPYMEPICPDDTHFKKTSNPFGSGRVKESFFVRSDLFLSSALDYLKKQSHFKLLTEKLEYSQIDPLSATYKNESFHSIVFCQGYLNRENPWFNTLKIDSTKGQILSIRCDELWSEEALNRKCFILPNSKNTFKVGSTYEWHDHSLHTTEEAREQIESNFQSFGISKYMVLDQIAGIRPTTFDRRPIVGKHWDFPKLSIFNGLGAKGYLIAPKLAKEFSDYLVHDIPLDSEINLERLHKK